MANYWKTLKRKTIKSVTLALIVGVSFPVNAGAVELFTFYADCELGLIDTDANTSTPVGNIGWSIEAMDYGPDRLLYAAVEQVCGPHGKADTLAIIDPATLTVTPIGPIDPALQRIDVDAIAFHPDGTLYGISMRTYELMTIDTTTGLGTVIDHIGIVPGTFLGAIDFLPDGTLLLIDMLDANGGPSSLWTLDLVTADGTHIGALGFDSVEGMSLGPDGQLYALAKSMEADQMAELVTVDPVTGVATFVQHMPLPLPDYHGARDALVAVPPLDVSIDIKPFSRKNRIRPWSWGFVPVAILGSEDFDALQVDIPTVRFGPDGAKAIRWRTRVRDVNHDSFPDLVLSFKIRRTGIQCGDTEAELTGETHLGESFAGTDSITTVRCN